MTFHLGKFGFGLAVAFGLVLSASGGQAQQGIDAARASCLAELQKMYPNHQPDTTNREALSLYQQCMRQRGFTP